MVPAIMETEICHDMPSANWRIRKAGGTIQYESKGLRTNVAAGVNSVNSGIHRPENQEL